jgi:hypothetical protein
VASNSKVAVADSASLRITDYTVIVWADFMRLPLNASRLLSKRDGAGAAYEFYYRSPAGGQIHIYDGVNTRTATITIQDYGSVAVAGSSGAVPNLYAGGSLIGAFSGIFAPDITKAAALNICDSYVANQALQSPCSCAILYDAELTGPEIALLETWHNERVTPRKQWPGMGLQYPGGIAVGDPRFIANIQTARVSIAAESSGILSNTGFRIESGSWKVAEDSTGRYIECTANGKIRYHGMAGASGWSTGEFAIKAGTPTLTKNAASIDVDAITGDSFTALVLNE